MCGTTPRQVVYNRRNNLSGEDVLTEADWVNRARRGDGAAWEQVVQAHQQAVFRLAYLLLGDADDAEDTAQEAFIRAYGALERFDTARPLRPWLMQITANLARNRRRALGRYWAAVQRLVRAEPQTRGSRAAAPPSNDDTQLLWQAIRRLNDAEQEIIYLRYFLEMPEAEMAAALSIAPGTVKSRLHRALARLRAIVQNAYPSLREMLAE
jgi:RNA polymerase sigma-70 factor (ECF subfamily)